ncbi:glycosyltransferase [Amnibacterium endophyticum]|uniref:Glycosyltransferase n=1 Tax=Amnibacterium endophyticum TaxID=2109337 RepID=A0ABW4LF35_9MICO
MTMQGRAVAVGGLREILVPGGGRLGGVAPVGPVGFPVLDPGSLSIDHDLLRTGSLETYLAEGWMPLERLPGRVLVGTSLPPGHHVLDGLAARLGAPVQLVALAPWALREHVLAVFDGEVADAAANRLWREQPVVSARIVLSRGQRTALWAALAVVVPLVVLFPRPAAALALGIGSAVFLAATGFKLIVAMRGARFDVVEQVTAEEVAALDDAGLPVYTVLVPVFREANIVAQLVENLGGLDWPASRLEVLVLVEEEDDETRAAIEAASPPEHFRIVTVPAGAPQTKPRACNVGLSLATGEYLVIYDAEDTPDPDQLKKALVAFRRGGDDLVCVQAALNYFNATENALTRMFTLEYSYWFDYMLAGLDASDLPIPLGGTSNHFRTDALRRLGGWDPFNVTEDADLGVRASAMGYRVGVINSTTMEEANTSIPNFVRQRSRWIKGYMQTTLVHARQPLELIARIGLRRFLAFALLIGGTPAVFLGVLPSYLVTGAVLLMPASITAGLFPAWVLWLCLLNFVLGNSLMIYLSMMGPYKRGNFNLVLWSLLNPVYWVLHSIASYKALWQLVTRPHYWEKTAHGLTTHVA